MDYLQSYTYECNTGFNTSDPVCVVCQPNGVLSIDPPTCAGITDALQTRIKLIHEMFGALIYRILNLFK